MRDEKGRFIKGSTGNPAGRPKKEREQRFYELTISTVTFDDWRAIILKAVAQAKKGDQAARKFLADYLVGIPERKLDVTSGGEPLKAYVNISPDDWQDGEE